MKDLSIIVLLIVGAYLSFYTKKLTLSAAITGAICGWIIYLGTSYTGLCMLAVFFLSSTLATAWGKNTKQFLTKTVDTEHRKYGQVLANAGSATLFSLLAVIFPDYTQVFMLLVAASLASATADTLSSELGILYGKRFYNCISWKREERGLDGVISTEGSLIGVFGSVIIASIYMISAGFDYRFFILVFAGAAGNFADSIFGASFERLNLLNNDWVNFLSTLFAAGVVLLLDIFFL